MKLFAKIALGLAMVVGLTACDNVPAGFVGVKVNKYGDDRGVDIEVKNPGKYMQSYNTEVFLFPTFTQTRVWDSNPPVDESFEFQSNGMSIRTNMGVAYHILPENAPKVFQKYRKGLDEITNVYLRNMIRDTLSSVGPRYNVSEVHTTKRADLEKEVADIVKAQAAEVGISIERVFFVGKMSLPQQIVDSINATVQADQDAKKKVSEVEREKAEADRKKEEALGEANAAIERAKGVAKAIEIEGEALRKNPMILEKLKIEKWNGDVTKVAGPNAATIMKVD